jgi:hypothetical protein
VEEILNYTLVLTTTQEISRTYFKCDLKWGGLRMDLSSLFPPSPFRLTFLLAQKGSFQVEEGMREE